MVRRLSNTNALPVRGSAPATVGLVTPKTGTTKTA